MFRIGQKVVCVSTTVPQGHYKKDNIYTISHICYCPGCKQEILFCGINSTPPAKLLQCTCGTTFNSDTYEMGAKSNCFAPLSYSTNCNKEIIEKFSPLEEKSDVKIREYEPVKTSLLK